MSVAEEIASKLTRELSPQRLEVHDDSHRHAGHAGAPAGGESHFRLEIVSSAFEGKGRIERQRMVHALLATELAQQIHALQIRALTPVEDA